jgi:hypothetical protein
MWHESCSILGARTEKTKEKKMHQERSAIMEKARVRRRRREKSKSIRLASRKRGKAPSVDAAAGLTGKVADFAQGTAAQIGALVKSAASKITGA